MTNSEQLGASMQGVSLRECSLSSERGQHRSEVLQMLRPAETFILRWYGYKCWYTIQRFHYIAAGGII
ncbi:MAG: hypothetical protein ACI808_002428 [Paraglaciecola sp.]|jgi:hypothetical protein